MTDSSELLLEYIKSLPDERQSLIHQKITDHLYLRKLRENRELEKQQNTSSEAVFKDIPLTPAQMASIGDLPNEQLSNFVISFLYRLRDDVEVNVFEKAVRHMVSRHTALRTFFVKRDERWVQNYKQQSDDNVFVYLDFDNVNEIDEQATLQSIIQQAEYHLPLEQELLFQVLLVSMKRKYLLIRANHLIYDYVSNQIVVEELATIYQHLIDETTDGYPILLRPSQLGEFSRAVHDVTHSPQYESAISYWKNLDINQYTQLPLAPTQNYSSVTYDANDFYYRIVEIPRSIINRLYESQSYELVDWLLTALGVCLNEWSKTRGWVIRLSHHGRTWEDVKLNLLTVVGPMACSRIFGLTYDPDDVSTHSPVEITHRNLQQVPREGGLFWSLYNDSVHTTHREQLLKLYGKSEISFNMVADAKTVQQDVIYPANIKIDRPFSFTRENRKMVIGAKLTESKMLSMFWSFDLAFFNRDIADYLCDNYARHLSYLIKMYLD